MEFVGILGIYAGILGNLGIYLENLGIYVGIPTFPTIPILEISEKSKNLDRIWENEAKHENTNFSITTITEGKRRSGPYR